MNKLALLTTLTAITLSSMLSQSVHADDSNPLNNFYVAGNLGQTQYRADADHDHSVFQNVRIGWRWNGYVGPEIGYAYLGRLKDTSDYGSSSLKSRAATIGVNGKYDFYGNWFVTAHTGYMRSRTKISECSLNEINHFVENICANQRTWNNGWYGGLGIGYDVTHNVSIGVNYDNYHLQYGNGSTGGQLKNNIAAFSGSVEYRF